MRQSWYSPGLLFQSLLQKLNLKAGRWKWRKRPRASMEKTKRNKKNKTKQKVPWRKAFLRSGDGHKVEGVTVAQKMRQAKNGARIKRFTLNKFLSFLETFKSSSPAQSSERDTGGDPRRRHNKSTTDKNWKEASRSPNTKRSSFTTVPATLVSFSKRMLWLPTTTPSASTSTCWAGMRRLRRKCLEMARRSKRWRRTNRHMRRRRRSSWGTLRLGARTRTKSFP